MPAASNALDNHMPRYFFDVTDTGTTCRDDEGIEPVDLEAARREAFEALGGIARDELPNGDHRDFAIDIRKDSGPVVLTASLSLRVERKN